MIEYDNGATIGILFRMSGSVVPGAVPIGLLTGLLGLGLAILRNMGDENQWLSTNIYSEKIIANAVAIQIFASVLGYLLVVRTNMALSRWMEAISNVEEMLSKWGDAFKALSGFFAGKKDTEERLKRIMHFRARVAHWFSLMACLAFATLRCGRIDKLDDVPIKVMLHPEDPEGESKLKKKQSFAVCRKSQAAERGSEASRDAGPVFSLGMRLSQTSKQGGTKVIGTAAQERAQLISEMDLCVLYSPTPEEVLALDFASDKVNIISLWIIQGIMIEVRAKTLDTPPPIVTRILQELSNGMLGFNQAHKVAMTPFPFPFAQMVSMLLILMDVIFPFYVDCFTQNVVVTPIISFLIPICYHGLNNTAIELEEPFGTDWNDVDIENRNEAYQNMLIDTLRMPTVPPYEEDWPKASATRFEKTLSRKLSRQTQWLVDRHPESQWQWDIYHLDAKLEQPEEDKDQGDGSQVLEPVTAVTRDEPPAADSVSEGHPSWAEESNQEETEFEIGARKHGELINGLGLFSSCEAPDNNCCTTERRQMVIDGSGGIRPEMEAGHDRHAAAL